MKSAYEELGFSCNGGEKMMDKLGFSNRIQSMDVDVGVIKIGPRSANEVEVPKNILLKF